LATLLPKSITFLKIPFAGPSRKRIAEEAKLRSTRLVVVPVRVLIDKGVRE
jgi:hypothetical protein